MATRRSHRTSHEASEREPIGETAEATREEATAPTGTANGGGARVEGNGGPPGRAA